MSINLKDIKNRYERDGFILLEKFLPDAVLADIQAATTRFTQQAEAG